MIVSQLFGATRLLFLLCVRNVRVAPNRKTPGAFRKDLSTAYARAIKNGETLPGLEKALDDVDALKGKDSGLSTQIRAYAHRHKDAFAALEKEGGSDAVKRALAGLTNKSTSIDKAEKAIRDGLLDEMVRLATDPAASMAEKVVRFDKFEGALPKDASRPKNRLRAEVEAHIVHKSSTRAQAELDRMLGNGEIRDINRINATDANKRYTGRRGKYNPPYPEGSNVWDFTTDKETKFVRIHVNETEPAGGFLLLSEKEFARLGGDAEAIRRYLRLKDRPGFVSDVRVPARTKMRAGIIGLQPKLGFNSSSGVQFELLTDIPKTSFGHNVRPLK
jgi:hypothetical protein